MDKNDYEFRKALGYFSGVAVGMGILLLGGTATKAIPKILPKVPEVVTDILNGAVLGASLSGAMVASDAVRAKYDRAVINNAKDIITKAKEAEQNA